MNLFGWEIAIRKKSLNLSTVNSRSSAWRTWWGGPILESFTGAWQRNITVDPQPNLLAFSAVFACVTGIAGDVAKMRIKLTQQREKGIWEEITSGSPFLPVLRKPNHYQIRMKFVEQWIVSKLLHGNTYVLKQRDGRGIVTQLYILDPTRVKVLVAESGDVYYELQPDNLSGSPETTGTVTVPARDVIHDTMTSFFHPLVGVSPIYACGLSATMGNRIQANSTNFFANASTPSGILSSPAEISDETAMELKKTWEANYGGSNRGRVAVVGDGLTFQTMAMSGEQAQLIEQLKWTVEDVARAFHYPVYKLGGPLPAYAGNIEALTLSYYSDCLQTLIESLEGCLDEGLSLPENKAIEFDLEGLMRMDTAALYESNNKAVGGGWMSPDEARSRANLSPVPGGDSPFMQQQMWSLRQLSERSAPTDAAAADVPPAPKSAKEQRLHTTDFDYSKLQTAPLPGSLEGVRELLLGREDT